jgi:hypothetical protein
MSKRRPQETIPVPYEDVRSLRSTVMAMKERVEVISGQRGTDMLGSAVTWEDLVSLKLIKPSQVPLP